MNRSSFCRAYLALSAFDEPVDPDFVALINPFWLKFNPAPAPSHYALGIVHSLIMVIGLFGNALFIFMFMWYVMCGIKYTTLMMLLLIHLCVFL